MNFYVFAVPDDFLNDGFEHAAALVLRDGFKGRAESGEHGLHNAENVKACVLCGKVGLKLGEAFTIFGGGGFKLVDLLNDARLGGVRTA